LAYNRVKELHAKKKKVSTIARIVGISRTTVYKYINADVYPKPCPKTSLLTPYLSFLSKRIEAGLKKVDLYNEVVAQGYKGSYRNFCQTMTSHFPNYKSHFPETEPEFLKRYNPHRLSYAMIKQKDEHPEELKSFYKLLFENSPTVETATKLTWQLCQIIRQRTADKLDEWLAQMEESELIPLVNFAAGVRKDYEAIKNACTLKWSNGQVEGQVNRLKNIKRQTCLPKVDIRKGRF